MGEGLEIKGAGLKVRDLLDAKADVSELGVMDGPGWVRDVDCVDGLVDLSEREACDEERAGPRQGLAGCDLRCSLSIKAIQPLFNFSDDLPVLLSVQLYP